MRSEQGPDEREESDGTYIEDKVTGEKIWVTDDGGIFMVKMWVNRKAGF